MRPARPVGQRVRHPERRAVEGDRRVRTLEPEAGRDLPVMQRQRRLDQPRDPRRRVQVPDVGLDRADAAVADGIRCLAERLAQRRDLQRVAQPRARAVPLDIADRVRAHARQRQRLGHRARLPVDRRREVARLARAVVVDRAALQHRPNMIAVGQRIGQPPQHDHTGARAEDGPLGPVIVGVAGAVGRQDLVLAVDIPAPLRQLDRRAAGQRHVALARQQRLRGVMHRHQRGRACRLHAHRGPRQVEDVADPRRQEVLVVAGMAQQEHPRPVHQVGIAAQVEIEIAAHPAAAPDADPPVEPVGHVAGILHRLPRDLEKAAMLGVHDRRLLGRQAQELGIDRVEPLERCGVRHVGRIAHSARILSGGAQRVVVQPADRRDSADEVAPIGVEIRRTGQVGSHADDRDVAVLGCGNAVALRRGGSGRRLSHGTLLTIARLAFCKRAPPS